MLDLSTAVLCDFAQVRDRLLFVSSGAVSRLYRQELPSPLGLMVGLVIEVPLEDAGMEHRLRAEVINRHGTVLATLENLFRVSDEGLFPHEVQQVPLVLSITGVRARTWGTHQVRLYLDDDLVRALTLYVVPAAGPQAVVRAAPTESRVADDESVGVGDGDAPGDGGGAPPPSEPAPWSDPAETPAPLAPATAEAGDEPHEIVLDLDPAAGVGDGEVITVVADDAPAGTTDALEPAFGATQPGTEPAPVPAFSYEAAPPAVAEAASTSEPSADPWTAPEQAAPPQAPAPAPVTTPSASYEGHAVRQPGSATIDAPRAEPVPARAGGGEVARPFDTEGASEEQPTPGPAEQEKSRFSFRYRYDDDEGEDESR